MVIDELVVVPDVDDDVVVVSVEVVAVSVAELLVVLDDVPVTVVV